MQKAGKLRQARSPVAEQRSRLTPLLSVSLPKSLSDLSPESHQVARGGGAREETRSPVGGWGRSSRWRWRQELRSPLGGGGRFPGRPELGLAVPTGAPAADGPRPLCPRSAAAARSNVTAGPRAGVRGAGQDFDPPPEGPGCQGGGATGRGRGGGRRVGPIRGSGICCRPRSLQPVPRPPLRSPLPPDLWPSNPSSLLPPFSSPPLTPFLEASLPYKSPSLISSLRHPPPCLPPPHQGS